jgi:site-specific DNA-methyltransferase (adenine-specific)
MSDGLTMLDRVTDTAFKYIPKKADRKPTPLERFSLFKGDALAAYDNWVRPSCIIADGPYGLGKYPGEPISPDGLAEWYEPHAAAWARHALPSTTLWFWNSEIGWANAHPALERNGWQYEETVVWDKGIAHVAGNCNSKTIRGVPVVTELAVRYTRKVTLETEGGAVLPIKEWLRAEWQRSGRPLYESNKACGVVNAATRKYLTQCHMWYFPPGDAIVGMAEWCTKRGAKTDRPYFSIDGKRAPTAEAWDRMRAKWTHAHGLTNVWQAPPVHNGERVRLPGSSSKYLHANQKPLALMERQIAASTSKNDVVWEPFGGLCSATVAAVKLGRRAFSAEINAEFYKAALTRIKAEIASSGSSHKAA